MVQYLYLILQCVDCGTFIRNPDREDGAWHQMHREVDEMSLRCFTCVPCHASRRAMQDHYDRQYLQGGRQVYQQYQPQQHHSQSQHSRMRGSFICLQCHGCHIFIGKPDRQDRSSGEDVDYVAQSAYNSFICLQCWTGRYGRQNQRGQQPQQQQQQQHRQHRQQPSPYEQHEQHEQPPQYQGQYQGQSQFQDDNRSDYSGR